MTPTFIEISCGTAHKHSAQTKLMKPTAKLCEQIFSVRLAKCLAIILCSLATVQAKAQVTANFTADSTEGCGLLSLGLENLSTGATSYLWEVFDASGTLVSTSTLFNPTFFLTEPGAYTVSLTATGASGTDNLTLTDYAFVYAPPTADFDASGLDGCPPIELDFSDSSVPGTYGSISDYYWVITGASTLPPTPDISYTFVAPGTYTVYLFVTDGAGCSDYFTQSVLIYDSVHADFTSDAAVACTVPLEVNFTNLSSGSGSLTYEWNFGDGGNSTALNPSHTYSDFGDYDVTLIVTSADGCSDTIKYFDYIQLNPTADVDFDVEEDTVCEGSIAVFDNLSGAAVGTWFWDFGDGYTSTAFEPTHIYADPGTYTVSLDGDFGGGCMGSVTHANVVTVVSAPLVSFSSTDHIAVCQVPFSVDFTSSVGGGGGPVTYLWQFEDVGGTFTSTAANPSYTWNELGSYDVSLTVTNSDGCQATYTMTDYVVIGELEVTPVANPEDGCVPLHVNFSATAGEALASYDWDLGDGSSSASATPSNVYGDVGCYTITLIATSVSGCTDTTTIVDLVCAGDTATADLILPDTACPGTPLTVLYLPLDSITAIIDGGLDDAIATPVDSSTTISLPTGDHDIDFITWSYGCPDTISGHIYILDVVDSLMQVDYSCADPYTVQIYIDTSISNLSCGWIWDFGDGTYDSVSANPVHTYAEPGTYHVVVTYLCMAPVDCQGTGVTVNIQVPFADFTADPYFGCDTPLVVNFTNNSTDYINDVLTYFWDFGDGFTETTESPTHTFTDFGAYYVSLTVTDDRGCVNEMIDTIGVGGVTAGYDIVDAGGCVPFTINITDTSHTIAGDVTQWIFDWDDGTIDTFYSYADVVGLEHTFTVNNNFYVTLTAIDEFGCSDVYVDTIKAGDPVADFTVDDTIPCIGQLVYFSELSTGFSLDYAWDFGDGGTADIANPSHTYAELGLYDVSLIVTDVNGCVDSISKPAYIETDTVSGDFSATVLVASCNYALIEFNSFSDDSICEYLWEFGDGGISVDPNPVYPYLTAGEYSVSLTLSDCEGCSSTISKTGYIVVPGPYGTITFSDDTLCVDHPMEVYVTVASTDTMTLYFDNGDIIGIDVPYSDTLQTITIPYTYTAAGVYLPDALLVDTNGCLNIIYGGDSIWVGNNPIAGYIVPDVTQCLGTPFTFTDTSSSPDPIELWAWNLGDALIFSDTSADYTHNYPDTGFYQTSLYVFTGYGCVDSMFIDVNVLAYPEVTLTPDSVICPGQTVPLLAEGGTTYTWTPSEGLSDTSVADPLATPENTTNYVVEVSNGFCSSFDSVLVTVVDKLILNAGPDTVLCIGADIQLFSEFITQVNETNISYYWTPSDYLSDPFAQNPVSHAIDDISYTIYASCGNLSDSASADIQVSIPPDIEIPSDTIIMITGQTVEITSELIISDGPVSYQWQPVSEVDCGTCESVFVSPESNSIFSVEVTDALGCSDIDFVLVRVLSCDETLFFIPNIISPNNDGMNDIFKFSYEGLSTVTGVKIFNRWGELMFQTTNLDEHWDGTFNGQVCNPGVYVYTIGAVCLDGTETIISGNITLVR